MQHANKLTRFILLLAKDLTQHHPRPARLLFWGLSAIGRPEQIMSLEPSFKLEPEGVVRILQVRVRRLEKECWWDRTVYCGLDENRRVMQQGATIRTCRSSVAGVCTDAFAQVLIKIQKEARTGNCRV